MDCYTSFDYKGVEKWLEINNVPIIARKDVSYDESQKNSSGKKSKPVEIDDYDRDLFAGKSNIKNTKN